MKEPRRADAAPRSTRSQSVGSLPGPFGLGGAGLGASGLEASGLEASDFVGSRVLAGRWQQALRAERALGWVLWTALAAVLFLVSR
jgi:hypothetical protein